MDLPNDEIGISDILSWRDCPRRMSASMRRHPASPRGEFPEMTSSSNSYGSAIHDAISYVEEHDSTDEEAVQFAFKIWSRWLDPGDIEQMREDLALYRERDPGLGCRTVLNEGEIRVPLMEYGGRTIYFRGRIDRLYQRLDDETRFIHVDYKSSAWPKTPSEVDDDLQFWAYNWAIHEVYPECESMVQHYDQLRYGVLSTSKTEDQRRQIKEWLQLAVIAIIEDDTTQPDGLLEPKWNQWCPWCQIKMDCPVVTGDMTRFSEATIRGLAPVEPVLLKDGSPGKRTVMKLDIDLLDDYVSLLPKVGEARKTLEDFEKQVREALRKMPEQTRHALGYKIRESNKTTWTPEGLRAVHDLVGEEFYYLVGLTQTALDTFYDSSDPTLAAVKEQSTKIVGSQSLVKDD